MAIDMVSRIKKLCTESHITIAELERKTNLSNGTIRRWNEKTPGIDKVQKVADFFNVSVDYLLGRTDLKQHGSEEYEKIIEGYPEIFTFVKENTSDEKAMNLLKEFIKFQEKMKGK
ncbi:helix-turn-helix domain-containing protein [Listeria costaricensis]|uniref:helix-turn-helix domain-containing protein n=1 Tax=Listeria costaricensis TaxID=2026604 RepID=UPI001F0902F9|nr:helix-turn-helix transcriptional regulator [Listeria costaricensis]